VTHPSIPKHFIESHSSDGDGDETCSIVRRLSPHSSSSADGDGLWRDPVAFR